MDEIQGQIRSKNEKSAEIVRRQRDSFQRQKENLRKEQQASKQKELLQKERSEVYFRALQTQIRQNRAKKETEKQARKNQKVDILIHHPQAECTKKDCTNCHKKYPRNQLNVRLRNKSFR